MFTASAKDSTDKQGVCRRVLNSLNDAMGVQDDSHLQMQIKGSYICIYARYVSFKGRD